MISLLASLTINATAVMLTPPTLVMMILFSVSGTMRVQGTALLFSRFIFSVLIMIGMFYFGQYVADRGGASSSNAQIYLSLILGALFIFFGISTYRRRPKDGDAIKVPKFFDKLSHLNAFLVIAINLAMMLTSVKNLALMASAATAIAQFSDNWGVRYFWIFYYSFLCCVIMFGLWAISLFGGQDTQAIIEKFRDWLYKNGSVIVAAILIGFGLYELFKAMQVML